MSSPEEVNTVIIDAMAEEINLCLKKFALLKDSRWLRIDRDTEILAVNGACSFRDLSWQKGRLRCRYKRNITHGILVRCDDSRFWNDFRGYRYLVICSNLGIVMLGFKDFWLSLNIEGNSDIKSANWWFVWIKACKLIESSTSVV